MRLCITCKEEKELNSENFAMTKRNSNGFSNECKTCKSKYDKEYRRKNKEKINARKREYAHLNREREKERSKEWYKNNQDRVKKYRKENKERITDYNKKYWDENKEELKPGVNKWRKENAEYIKQYRKDNYDRDKEKAREWGQTERGNRLRTTKTNRYRAKKKSLKNDFTAAQWNECKIRFEQKCAYCGNDEKLEQEHFIPVTKNGDFTKTNIIPSCRSCNASKLNRDFFEWYSSQDYYSKEREMKILDYLGVTEIDSFQIYR